MRSLSDSDLHEFQKAIFKDYGIKLEGKELYDAAFNLLQFFEGLIKYNNQEKLEAEKEKDKVRKSS